MKSLWLTFKRVRNIARKAAAKAERKTQRVYLKEMAKHREDFFKTLREEHKNRTDEQKALRKEHEVNLKKELKELARIKDSEIAYLKEQVKDRDTQVKRARRAYLMYREYSDYIERVSDNLQFASTKLLNRHAEGVGLIARANNEIMNHQRRMRKLHPRITKLLGMESEGVSGINDSIPYPEHGDSNDERTKQ